MPTTYTEALEPTKSSKTRTVRWTPCEAETSCLRTGKLVIDTDRQRCTYGLVEIPTSWAGRAVTLVKADGSGEFYDVFAHESDRRQDRCDCKAFSHTGGCKHLDALRAITFENRWLADPRANPDQDVGNTEAPEMTDDEFPECFRGCGPLPDGCPL